MYRTKYRRAGFQRHSPTSSKKNEVKPHLQKCYVIPPEQDGDFVAAMEDVLDVYVLPYNPKRPVVCMDEQPRQLIGEELVPIPAKPGQVLRYDNQYVRNGTVCNFMFFQPLGNWRRVSVRKRRTQKDRLGKMREMQPGTEWIGNSPPKMHESNSKDFIHKFRCDGVVLSGESLRQ